MFPSLLEDRPGEWGEPLRRAVAKGQLRGEAEERGDQRAVEGN